MNLSCEMQCTITSARATRRRNWIKNETTAVGSNLMSASVDTDGATVLLTAAEAVPAAAMLVANPISVQSSGILDASEIAAAMRAMTAAAEWLTLAAAPIEAAVQQQQQQQLPPWHLHRSWHHVIQQHQQQLAYNSKC
jgi:hypothetical protein